VTVTVGISVGIIKISQMDRVLRRPLRMGQNLFTSGERSGQAVAVA